MDVFIGKNNRIISSHLKQILKNFFFITDINILFIDQDGLEIERFGDFCKLHFHTQIPYKKLKNLILEKIEKSKNPDLDTFMFSNYKIQYIAAPFYHNDNYVGSFIIGPFTLEELSSKDIEDFILSANIHKTLRVDMKIFTKNLPVKPVPKNFYLGQLIRTLTNQNIKISSQHICINTQPNTCKANKDELSVNLNKNEYFNLEHTFEKNIIKCIKENNVRMALTLYERFITISDFVDIGNKNALRSLKNHMIYMNSILSNSIIEECIDKNLIKSTVYNIINFIEKETCMCKLLRFGKIIIKTYSKIYNERNSNVNNILIKKALVYINKNIENDISLKKISQKLNISESYLSNLFFKHMGYSLCYYINLIKIERSKELLKNTKLSILDVAINCGFNNQAYFSSVFKKYTKITPTTYKNMCS